MPDNSLLSYSRIWNPTLRAFSSIESFAGRRVLRQYVSKALQVVKKTTLNVPNLLGGNVANVEHVNLGSFKHVSNYVTQSRKIFDNLAIENHTSDAENPSSQSTVYAYTVPHAGLQYSGLLACLTIRDLVSRYPINKVIYIIWFRHQPHNNPSKEHSLKNVLDLCNAMYPDREFQPYSVDNHASNSLHSLPLPCLVSTDFSHRMSPHNNQSLMKTWENDQQSIHTSKQWGQAYIKPCGHQGLELIKKMVQNKSDSNTVLNPNTVLQVQAYSNSEQPGNWWTKNLQENNFGGVTYAGVAAVECKSSFFRGLDSKLLAYSHLQAVIHRLFQSMSSTDSVVEGLFWSPLLNIVGSCFVTVDVKRNTSSLFETYSCFGSWEQAKGKPSSLLHAIQSACNSVRQNNWGNHASVSLQALKKFGAKQYKVSITLIEPKQHWSDVSQSNQLNTRVGHVYYNSKDRTNGVTFIPSVWDKMQSSSDYKASIKSKQGPSHAAYKLHSYNSISWSMSSLL